MIVNITGQAGSGKTTLARTLEKRIQNSFVIDGDELRDIFKNKDYSEEGRRRNITNAYNIARFLEAKGYTPILALISPYLDLREELKLQSQVKEIYLTTSQIRGRESFFAQDYVAPTSNFLAVSTDSSLEECMSKIEEYVYHEAYCTDQV